MQKIYYVAVIFTTLITLSFGINADTSQEPFISTELISGMDRNVATSSVFEAPQLKIGDQFPAVEIFDEDGNPFNTGNLKGQYTVLVNGCLT